MSATVTDITTVKKEKGNAEKISMSLMLPVDLYDKVKLDSILSKKPVGTMLEEWLDKNVSLEDTSIDLATLMNHAPIREKLEPGARMKGLTVLISRQHHNLLRMESMRKNSTLRSLLKTWVEENCRDFFIEPVEKIERQAQVV